MGPAERTGFAVVPKGADEFNIAASGGVLSAGRASFNCARQAVGAAKATLSNERKIRCEVIYLIVSTVTNVSSWPTVVGRTVQLMTAFLPHFNMLLATKPTPQA